MNVLVGTQFYLGTPDANRRQAAAAASMLALQGAEAVNLQWRDDVFEYPGVETLALLAREGRDVAGVVGRKKPVVVDLFDALARAAANRGLTYFAFFNNDIMVTPRAIDRVREGGAQTYAFSRRNVDAAGHHREITIEGIDLWAMDVAWWRANRHRFRTYILGEPCFDNVFTAIMMTHGRGVVLNRDGEIRHEEHPAQSGGLFARYNYYLAAVDSPYFSLWAKYVYALRSMRAAGAPEQDEHALMKRTFVWRQSRGAALWHAGRCIKARWRYERERKTATARAAGAPR